jgi:hypothetical protein
LGQLRVMTRKTLVIIIAAIVFATCAIMDAWAVVPAFKKPLQFLGLVSLIFLFYSYHQYRKRVSGERKAPSRLETVMQLLYYRVWRFGGFWFLIFGPIMTMYLTVAMINNNPRFPASEVWPGAVGSAFLTGAGFLIVRYRPFKPK